MSGMSEAGVLTQPARIFIGGCDPADCAAAIVVERSTPRLATSNDRHHIARMSSPPIVGFDDVSSEVSANKGAGASRRLDCDGFAAPGGSPVGSLSRADCAKIPYG